MSYAAAHPILTRLLADKGQRAMRAMCGCAIPHVAHAVPEQARELELLDWSVCPFWLLEHTPHLRMVDGVRRMLKVGIQPQGRLRAWAALALMGDA